MPAISTPDIGDSFDSGSPADGPFLAGQALVGLMLAPPLFALLLARFGSSPPSLSDAGACILTSWIYTAIVGGMLHFTVNWSAPRLFGALCSRALALACLTIGAAAVVVLGMLALVPYVAWLKPNEHEQVASLLGRALGIAGLYLVVARKIAKLAAHARANRESALRARLSALQSQMSPHFLFNTLNAVASLIPTEPAMAEATIERLAGVLQYSLASGRLATVSLGEELAAVRDYLGIEHARHGDRLRSSIDVSPELYAHAFLPMLLQPLVENAVLHGLGSREEGGEIRIVGRALDGALVLTVSDDGVGPNGSKRRGTQTALRGIRERLALTYGNAAAFAVRTRVGGGFECELRVP